MYTLVVLAICVLVLGAVSFGAQRFARRRRAEGAWTEAGPVRPTEPPWNFLRPRAGSGISLDMLLRRRRGSHERRRK
jgi:hypothetical protein